MTKMKKEEPGAERRQHPRKPVSDGLLILRTGFRRWIGSPSRRAPRFVPTDVSAGGIRIEDPLHRRRLRAGERIVFQIQSPQLGSFRAEGEVAWTRTERRNAVALIQVIGVRFAGLSLQAGERIAKL